jgi:hypothetical protein
MAVQTPALEASSTGAPLMLGGYAALAESEWMGAAQASEVLEPLRVVAPPRRAELPRPRLAGLLTRELTIREATIVLMASFFVSALLGAVRQVLFNAQFGAGMQAKADRRLVRGERRMVAPPQTAPGSAGKRLGPLIRPWSKTTSN